MSSETEKLQEINKRQREKMLLLKTRAQIGYNRPSPIVSNNASPNISYTYSNSIKNSSKPMTLQLLKQYESNKTNSQGDYSLDRGADKSVDYNSTLFKYFKQQSNLTDKDLINNNGSSISMQSGGAAQADQSNQQYKDDSLINKIDELLKKNKNKSKTGINQVYQEYLQKKTLSNSSGLSNHSNTNFSNQFSTTIPKLKSNTTSTYLQKLKTIQQQKLTLTIQRQQAEEKKRIKKNQQTTKQAQSRSMKKPPLAPTLSSVSAIQRQKKKIQDTIQQIKKQQSFQSHDKDSLILELSDNESQIQQKQQILIESKEKNMKNQKESSQKRQKLKQQKIKLLKQMQQIQRQLEQLQKQEQQLQM